MGPPLETSIEGDFEDAIGHCLAEKGQAGMEFHGVEWVKEEVYILLRTLQHGFDAFLQASF